MITQDQLKNVQERTEALHRYLDIDKKKIEFEEEDLRTQAPDFWEDPKRAEEQMKKVKGIKKWIDGYQEVKSLADELQLPVVPLSIDGPFDVLPRTARLPLVHWHPLMMKIHKPIEPQGKGKENELRTLEAAYEAVKSGMPAHRQKYVKNDDQ